MNFKLQIFDETFILQGKVFRRRSTTSIQTCWKAGESNDGRIDLESLTGHLLVVDRHLCFAKFKDDNLFLTGTEEYFSRNLPAFHRPADVPAAFSNGTDVFDMGYIGDFINEHSKCQALLKAKSTDRPRILQSISDPSQRQVVPYSSSDINKTVPLNHVQLQALKSMKYDVEGIQGPPGTGKSTMIYHIVNSFLGAAAISLATCVQNKAVDAIAEKLASANNIGFFVFGNEERLGLLAKRWTLPSQTERDERVVQTLQRLDALQSELKKLRAKVVRQLLKSYPARSADEYKEMCDSDPAVASLRSRVTTAEVEHTSTVRFVRAEILGRSRVMLCTVATAAGRLQGEEELKDFMERITAVILDEAGTSSESKLPLLLTLQSVDRIIPVGDHKQLEPFTHIKPHKKSMVCYEFQRLRKCSKGRLCRFTHATAAAAGGVSKTPMGYFQRLKLALPGNAIPTLIHQYRMHPRICEYVSSSFYNGKLCTPKEVSAARLSADAHGLYWISYPSCDAEEAPRRGSTSRQNSTEASLVASIAKCPSLRAKYVMVITFYKAQENLIRETLLAAGLAEDSDPKTGLRICSVDQAQGSEADVVILSCVRSNHAMELGFVTNTNRLNVGVSRARERLVVVGDTSTLGTDANWAALISQCQRVSVESLPPIGQGSSELTVERGVSHPAMPQRLSLPPPPPAARAAASRTVTVTHLPAGGTETLPNPFLVCIIRWWRRPVRPTEEEEDGQGWAAWCKGWTGTCGARWLPTAATSGFCRPPAEWQPRQTRMCDGAGCRRTIPPRWATAAAERGRRLEQRTVGASRFLTPLSRGRRWGRPGEAKLAERRFPSAASSSSS